MKIKLLLWAALSVVSGFSFAANTIDLVNTHMTCGSYTFSSQTSESEITKNCKLQEMKNKKHLFRSNQTVLQFATDQYQLVACDFKKGTLDSCKVKEK